MPILWILFGVHTWNQNAHQSRILWQQMIFLGPLSTNFYLFKNCELNYKFRKIDAHKYKLNHSTSEGAWFFSSHSWAIKPFISMYRVPEPPMKCQALTRLGQIYIRVLQALTNLWKELSLCPSSIINLKSNVAKAIIT